MNSSRDSQRTFLFFSFDSIKLIREILLPEGTISQSQLSIHTWFNLAGDKKSKETDLIHDVLPFFGDQIVTCTCIERMLRRRNTVFRGNFTRIWLFKCIATYIHVNLLVSIEVVQIKIEVSPEALQKGKMITIQTSSTTGSTTVGSNQKQQPSGNFIDLNADHHLTKSTGSNNVHIEIPEQLIERVRRFSSRRTTCQWQKHVTTANNRHKMLLVISSTNGIIFSRKVCSKTRIAILC